ncbi:MAG TPA: ATP-dependent protease ATPase subunit HslU [Phycisphaerae bacterium]|nr:ATP-dependent protease ATPase subunit HslU [Phycisphaerae bacterium]HNU46583.1 ATP-dependent protease ATPase subunit HslU [Phycisphaerae bacterium]
MQELTPKQIVEELDKYIIGQNAAKRMAAIAIRNRWRRLQLPTELREDIGPSNIIMMGPTGVGKTEIARRLAQLVNAPFLKVEATKYTEVGYHGRDVESIVRDLVELAVHMVRTEQTEVVRTEADRLTEERLLDLLLPATDYDRHDLDAGSETAERRRRNREKFRNQLRAGELEDRNVELKIDTKATPIGVMATFGFDQIDPEMQNFFDRLMPSQPKQRLMPVREARKIVFEEQCDKLIDREKVQELALRRAENTGIIFLDEIDKIAGTDYRHGPDVSRQGVQRDLLPIIEGCTVNTRYGPVRTDHVLFIAAGAFHGTKPSDLMPELQGRLPIRVNLDDLNRDDFVRILTEPKNALTKQQTALLATEGVLLDFRPDAITALADIAWRVNQSTENIGARRLMTVMETLMEQISFDAPARRGETLVIDEAYVHERLADIAKDSDLSRFIL